MTEQLEENQEQESAVQSEVPKQEPSCQIDVPHWGSTIFTVYKWIVSDRKVYIKQVTNQGASGLYEIKFKDGVTKPTAYRRMQVYQKGKVLVFDTANNELKMQIQTKEVTLPIQKANQQTAIKRNRIRVSPNSILNEFNIKVEEGVKFEDEFKQNAEDRQPFEQQATQKQNKSVRSQQFIKEEIKKQIKQRAESKKQKKKINRSKSEKKKKDEKEKQQKRLLRRKKKGNSNQGSVKEELEQGSVKEESQEQKDPQSEQQRGSEAKTELSDGRPRKRGRRRTKKQIQQAKEDHEQRIKVMMLKDEKTAREEAQLQLRIQKQLLARFGTKIIFEVDKNCKHRDQFRIKPDTVEKRGKLYSQIYGSNPMLADKKSYFEIGMKSLAFPNVTIGVIVEDNFIYDYSMNKKGCICFDAYSRAVYVEGEKQEYDVDVSVNDIVRIIVDVPERKIEWFLNNDCFAVTKIPQSLASKTLYPHLQTSNKGIKLKINRVDE